MTRDGHTLVLRGFDPMSPPAQMAELEDAGTGTLMRVPVSDLRRYASRDEVGSIRVVIADDNYGFVDVLRVMLDFCPELAVVAVARDGVEAVERAVGVRADVVLMDLGLPKLNGYEATKRLASVAPKIRVIALTGDSSDTAREQALAAGAVCVLLKGASPDEVRDAIVASIPAGASAA